MADINFITVDFETYYDKEYSLSKMTTEEYINDPRFEAIGVGLKFNAHKSHWYTGTDIARSLSLPDWSKIALIAHNARFDMAILAWKYGIRPAFIIDTLSMARPFHNANVGGSLAKLVKEYQLGEKGTEVVQALGKHAADFSPEELAQYGEYCKNDCDLTYGLFERLRQRLPLSELRLIDLTIRMYTEPVLRLDTETIQQEIDIEAQRKADLMAMVDQPKGVFSSNDKFAAYLTSLGVDPPMKQSPKKKNPDGSPMMVPAFAKSDADFVALLDHDDPMVVAAVEARLGTKSTQRETRAQRFMGIAQRCDGWLPVPLGYYNAHTGRYGGEEKINLQNLQRTSRKDPTKGLLRKAITADEGEVLIVEDLSQIEARLLVWVAQQRDRIEAFAQKRDVYSEQATVIYGRPVDRKANPDDFVPGFIGKAVVLGCLAGDTQVLTNSGWKSIVCVTSMDLLWDGEQWVQHLGVVSKGEKSVETKYGLTATGDHEILTEHGWRDWNEVNTNPSLFQSALSLAGLPSLGGVGITVPMEDRQGGNQSSSVDVGGKGLSTALICGKVGQHSAINALRSAVAKLARSIGGMPRYFRTMPIGNACSTAFQVSFLGATRLIARCSSIMGGAVYLCMSTGARGWQGEGRFLATSFPSPAGTYLNSTLTASTLTEGMNQTTFALRLSPRTQKTNETSPLCKSKSMTYDIAYAGPRNRFTVATDAGPVIVHNCGYGLGFLKFAKMIYVGMLGEKGILFDGSFVAALKVDVESTIDWVKGKPDLYARLVEDKPAALTMLQWEMHVACARSIISTFRDGAPEIVDLWDKAHRALGAMLAGQEYVFGGPTGDLIRVEGHSLILPNGMPIRYEGLERDDKGEYSYLRRKEGRIQRVKIYGGAVVENIIQALARIIITDAMIKIPRQVARVALQVHDEVVAAALQERAKEAQVLLRSAMRTPPPWATGLPLDSEGDMAFRYGEAK